MLEIFVGQKIGTWTVLSPAGVNKKRGRQWLCKCSCEFATETIVDAIQLRRGKSNGCKFCAQRKRSLPAGEVGLNGLLCAYKRNAYIRGLPFELTRAFIAVISKQNCYYCDKPPSQIFRLSGPSVSEFSHNNSVYVYTGIDRIDSTKGYTENNVVPSCGTHNLMRLDMTQDEFYINMETGLKMKYRRDSAKITYTYSPTDW